MSLGLLRKHTFRFISVSLALSVLFVCILDCDLLVHHVLAIHACNGGVGGFKVAERDETIALGELNFVSRNFGGIYERAKLAECVVESLLVDHGIKAADEQLGADLNIPLLVC